MFLMEAIVTVIKGITMMVPIIKIVKNVIIGV
jgi:hypothetical protein